LLVRSRGGEVGLRTKAIPDLDSSISFFTIRQDSELFFDGDTGSTVAGPPSLRTGIEVTNDYRPASWVHIDANLALSRARFLGFDTAQYSTYLSLAGWPQEQIGNAPGNFVFNAPWMIGSAGITLGEKTGWFSTLRWRYISERPLTEDGVFKSPPMNVINGTVGYRFDNGWRIQLDALNMLNSVTDQDTYAYGALLTTDSLWALCFPPGGGAPKAPIAVCQNGVMDYVNRPIEPLALRVTLAGPLDTIDTINIREMASELWRSVPAEPLRAVPYDWTGFYLGGHVDTSWAKTVGNTVGTVSGTVSPPIDGAHSAWHGGIQVGYDYMAPSRLVLGIVADISSGHSMITSGQSPGPTAQAPTNVSGAVSDRHNVFDSETVRGRLGYALDNVLLYGTGGFAWSSDQFVRTQLTGTLNNATAGTEEAVNTYLGGYTVGGGVAYAFLQNWNAFAEYRYTKYGSTTITYPFSALSTTTTTAMNTVEAGVNYKFNGWNAPVNNWHRAPAPIFVKSIAPRGPGASGYPYNWSGIYVGADGGFGFGPMRGVMTDTTGAPLAAYDNNVSGPFAGGYFGVNYQRGMLVVGLEGDMQRANLTGNNQQQASILATGTLPGGPYTIATTVKDYDSLRARVGAAFDRFLVYGTAGVAIGNLATSYGVLGTAAPMVGVTVPGAGPFASAGSDYSYGWTAGAGLEYAFTDTVLGRAEYRFTDLATSGFVNAVADAADTGHRLPISDFRAGIAYKFRVAPALAWQ